MKKASCIFLYIFSLLVISNTLLICIKAEIQIDIPVFEEDYGDNTNTIQLQNENIIFSVTGGENLPMYSFWEPSNDTLKYFVKFVLFFEAIDKNQNGKYDSDTDNIVPDTYTALPMLSWEFSPIYEGDDGTLQFNITSQNGAFEIQFRNYFGKDKQLKFDIVIQNYDFISSDPNSLLVLGFQLRSTMTNTETTNQNYQSEEQGSNVANNITFGEDAFFNSNPIAYSAGEEINVGLTKGITEEDTLAYLAYGRFSNDLMHDPTIGISPMSDSIGNEEDNNNNENNVWIIVGIAATVLFGLLMAKHEYVTFLLNRIPLTYKGGHQLSMEDVLENENRNKIIELIIEEPGIHFNELLRETNLNPGNLVWHLEILESFKVIKKQKVGQYITYTTYYHDNPLSEVDLKIKKSKTTMKILQIIYDNPGFYQSQIARRADLDHSTVRYHINKLKKAGVIIGKTKGRFKCYYVSEKL